MAADAAAMAAGRNIKFDVAPYGLTRQMAIDIALMNSAAGRSVSLDANTANDPAGDIVIGRWDVQTQTLAPTHTNPNAVQVRANRNAASLDGPLDLLFGSVFGTPTMDVSADATALATTADLLVFILDPTDANAFHLHGNPVMDVTAGKVQVNSTATCAADFDGNFPRLLTQQLRVSGTICFDPGDIVGPHEAGASSVPDPIADLLPDDAAWDALKASMTVQEGNGNGRIDSPGSFPPGYYRRGINISGSDAITLQAGLFMFGNEGPGGGGIKLAGNSSLTATNVTIFVDRDTDSTVTGTGSSYQITASTAGPYQGIAQFHHRDGDLGSPGQHDATWGSGGTVVIEGMIYIPNGDIVLGGNTDKEFGALVCRWIEVSGDINYLITGKGIPFDMKAAEYTYLVD
jgi:hypothetical protein